jgi:uncharacterized protein
MKYAVVLFVVLIGFWLWRKNREDGVEVQHDKPRAKPSTSASQSPQIMLSCAVCGVHIPKSDALVGKQGHYCSASHLQQREA